MRGSGKDKVVTWLHVGIFAVVKFYCCHCSSLFLLVVVLVFFLFLLARPALTYCAV